MVSVGKIRSNRGGSHSAWVKIGNSTFENKSIGYQIQALNKGYEYGVNNAAKRYAVATANSQNITNPEILTTPSDAYHLAVIGSSNSSSCPYSVSISGCNTMPNTSNCCPKLYATVPGEEPVLQDTLISSQFPNVFHWTEQENSYGKGGLYNSYTWVNASGKNPTPENYPTNGSVDCCTSKCVNCPTNGIKKNC
jgi:hypothetical protein